MYRLEAVSPAGRRRPARPARAARRRRPPSPPTVDRRRRRSPVVTVSRRAASGCPRCPRRASPDRTPAGTDLPLHALRERRGDGALLPRDGGPALGATLRGPTRRLRQARKCTRYPLRGTLVRRAVKAGRRSHQVHRARRACARCPPGATGRSCAPATPRATCRAGASSPCGSSRASRRARASATPRGRGRG